MTGLAFMDTETLGLAHDAEVWDFACILRDSSGREAEHQFFVEHDEAGAAALPEPFREDHDRRYRPKVALRKAEAADAIRNLTWGRHIVGAVPDFDTTRLAHLMRTTGVGEPEWHYHLIDVENLAVGFLAGVCRLGGASADEGRTFSWLTGLPPLPWDSEALSRAVGVNPGQFERHTAMGDARWARAIYLAVTGGS